jgi:5-methylcytosine-specific restriction endonuclease McrA
MDNETIPVSLPAVISREEADSKGVKWCWVHQQYEPIGDFGKSKGRPDGLQPLCKYAKAEQEAKRRATRDGYRPQAPSSIRSSAPEGMKWCAHHQNYCRTVDFGADARKRDGLQSSCRRAQASLNAANRAMETPEKKARIAARSAAWRAAHAEEIRKSKKSYYADNREKESARAAAYYVANQERLKARAVAYYEDNADRVKAYQNTYRLDPVNKAKIAERNSTYRDINKEKCSEYRSRYYTLNRERFRAHRRNRRARIRSAEGTHTAEDIQDIHRLQKGKCAICRKKLGDSYHVDHIVPIAKGGSNARSNLQLTHGRCNQQKNRKDPLVHMRSLGFLL